ncbi:MAG: hypothetical protein LC744_07165 [Chloroflexi bacterium]|nr:hypothetical protein [Chloroflexota bacterium]
MSRKQERSADRTSAEERWPDGLSASHQRAATGWRRHTRPMALLMLAVVMAGALAGLAGVEETLTEESGVATVTWHAPARIRNGEFFEMRLQVAAHEQIEELVVGVDASLWEDFTINTFFPAATEEASEEGELRFTFGPLEPGGSFLMKVDAQINPDMLWRNEGTVTVYDGERAIAELPIVMEVLP